MAETTRLPRAPKRDYHRAISTTTSVSLLVVYSANSFEKMLANNGFPLPSGARREAQKFSLLIGSTERGVCEGFHNHSPLLTFGMQMYGLRKYMCARACSCLTVHSGNGDEECGGTNALRRSRHEQPTEQAAMVHDDGAPFRFAVTVALQSASCHEPRPFPFLSPDVFADQTNPFLYTFFCFYIGAKDYSFLSSVAM